MHDHLHILANFGELHQQLYVAAADATNRPWAPHRKGSPQTRQASFFLKEKAAVASKQPLSAMQYLNNPFAHLSRLVDGRLAYWNDEHKYLDPNMLRQAVRPLTPERQHYQLAQLRQALHRELGHAGDKPTLSLDELYTDVLKVHQFLYADLLTPQEHRNVKTILPHWQQQLAKDLLVLNRDNSINATKTFDKLKPLSGDLPPTARRVQLHYLTVFLHEIAQYMNRQTSDLIHPDFQEFLDIAVAGKGLNLPIPTAAPAIPQKPLGTFLISQENASSKIS